jgi:phosphatidylserine decarboxylase
VPLFLLAIPAAVLSPAVGGALLAFGAFVVWFHRDPERTPPATGVVSPADGRVSVVREEGEQVRVGVFMNVTDVHVIRAPRAGAVEYRNHRPGAHRPAFSKESERNERVELRFDDYEVSMIAGWFARRIHPYVGVGDGVERGDRIGHVSFGSRADVLLPPAYDRVDVLVSEGDRVRAGETVVAYRG